MFGIEKLIDFMEEKLGVTVETNAVSQEAVLLYHEELDEEIFSEDVLHILPNPISFLTYLFSDGAEWIIGIALEAGTNNPLFLICLKDGRRVYQELLTEKDKRKGHETNYIFAQLKEVRLCGPK